MSKDILKENALVDKFIEENAGQAIKFSVALDNVQAALKEGYILGVTAGIAKCAFGEERDDFENMPLDDEGLTKFDIIIQYAHDESYPTYFGKGCIFNYKKNLHVWFAVRNEPTKEGE